MIELHIYLEPHEGREKELEALYWHEYVPGISIQDGFKRTTLIKRRNALREYQIDIGFQSEELRLKWVHSKEHQGVWPRITSLCARASWNVFETVEKPIEA